MISSESTFKSRLRSHLIWRSELKLRYSNKIFVDNNVRPTHHPFLSSKHELWSSILLVASNIRYKLKALSGLRKLNQNIWGRLHHFHTRWPVVIHSSYNAKVFIQCIFGSVWRSWNYVRVLASKNTERCRRNLLRKVNSIILWRKNRFTAICQVSKII